MATKVESQGDDDYDPVEHRDLPHPNTNFEAFLHLVKAAVGTGILATAEAFKHAGIITGLIGTVFIVIVMTYGLYLVIQSNFTVCKKQKVPLLSYRDAMKGALDSGPKCLAKCSNFFAIMVDVFIITYQLGLMPIYTIFVAENIRAVVIRYTDCRWSTQVYTLCLLVPLLLMISFPNLKVLAPVSTVANILSLISFIIIFYYIFRDLKNFDKLDHWGSHRTFPLFFGTAMFAMEPVGMITSIVNNMKTPQHFLGACGVLILSMIVVATAFTLMGFFGYWTYGADTKSNITLNLQVEHLSTAVLIMYALAIYLSYAVNAYVPVEILWNHYILQHMEGKKHLLFREYCLRYGLVLFTFIPAVLVPLLGLCISLMGALCLSNLGIIFPALMDLSLKSPNLHGRCKWKLVKNIILIIIGILGGVAGIYCSIRDIVRDLHKHYSQ